MASEANSVARAPGWCAARSPDRAGCALVIGASGLVGGALLRALGASGQSAVGTGRRVAPAPLRALDITDSAAIDRLLAELAPHVVFLPAALTNVDYCEDHPDEAYAINVRPVAQIAARAAALGALLVYYSTDYVFDGTAGPYDETAPPHPLSVYGRTKLEAEQAIQAVGGPHLILRTTVVYGWAPDSLNSAMQIWRRLSAGEPMRVPSDQLSNPTLVDYLAEVSLRLVQDGTTGVLNVVGRDLLPRTDFARAVARALGLDASLIEDVPTAALGQRAPRPLRGGLTTAKLQALLGTAALSLDEALERFRRASELGPALDKRG